jgi:putative flippase GtrA
MSLPTSSTDAGEPHLPPAGPLTRLLRSQHVAYLVVGAVNTAIGLAFFALAHWWFGGVIGYMGSLVVAYALAILVAFTLHRRFVFRVSGHWTRDLLRFTGVQASSLGINAVLLPLLVEVAGLGPVLAQTIATGLTVVVSFFAHKYFSFARDLGPGHPGDLIEHELQNEAPQESDA